MMEHVFPEVLVGYLLGFRPAFSQPGWRYFQGFIWAMLLAHGRKCVSQIARACFWIDRTLSSWERFLSEQHWDTHQVQCCLVSLLQRELGEALRYSGRYVLAFDPTFVAKVKGRMLGVQAWRQQSENPDRGTQVVGHHWLLGGMLAKLGASWRCFPVWSRLISGQRAPSHFVGTADGQLHVMTIWETTMAMVLQAVSMLGGVPIVAVMDAYFAKAIMFNFFLEEGRTLITRLRHDAVGWDDPIYCGHGRRPKRGKKWKLAELWQDAEHRDTIQAHVYGKAREVSVVVRDLWLRDVNEKIRVVIVEGVQRPFLLACTDLSMTATQIIELYAARFSMELAIKDLKGFVGLGDYQCTTTLAFLRSVLLSCVALCIGRLLLHGKKVDSWLAEFPGGPVSETSTSFARLRRGLRCFALKHVLFSKFPEQAESEKLQEEFKPLLQLAVS